MDGSFCPPSPMPTRIISISRKLSVTLTCTAASRSPKRWNAFASTQRTNPTGWVTGRGLDVNPWKSSWPKAADLDRVVPDRPVAIFTHDYHSLWVNSRALARAKVTKNTADPPGGRIGRDAKGNPTGMLFETAYSLVSEHLPKSTPLQDERLIQHTQSIAHKAGVAAIGDMGEAATLRAFAALASKDRLRLRLWKSIPLPHLDHAIASGSALRDRR
jgi:predicted amidohydrolase YtcJ